MLAAERHQDIVRLMTESFGRNVCNRKPKILYARKKAERLLASNSKIPVHLHMGEKSTTEKKNNKKQKTVGIGQP
jgi:hypothetical protein